MAPLGRSVWAGIALKLLSEAKQLQKDFGQASLPLWSTLRKRRYRFSSSWASFLAQKLPEIRQKIPHPVGLRNTKKNRKIRNGNFWSIFFCFFQNGGFCTFVLFFAFLDSGFLGSVPAPQGRNSSSIARYSGCPPERRSGEIVARHGRKHGEKLANFLLIFTVLTSRKMPARSSKEKSSTHSEPQIHNSVFAETLGVGRPKSLAP